ncbi:MAG: hypothetical protein MUF23_02305 [Pirellula sp.]|nr:hypothetical protein [Pirellula sp.]
MISHEMGDCPGERSNSFAGKGLPDWIGVNGNGYTAGMNNQNQATGKDSTPD